MREVNGIKFYEIPDKHSPNTSFPRFCYKWYHTETKKHDKRYIDVSTGINGFLSLLKHWNSNNTSWIYYPIEG